MHFSVNKEFKLKVLQISKENLNHSQEECQKQ